MVPESMQEYFAAVGRLEAAERQGNALSIAQAQAEADRLWCSIQGGVVRPKRSVTSRISEYQRGYNAGYHAGLRAARKQ